jgi:hypothetical protein
MRRCVATTIAAAIARPLSLALTDIDDCLLAGGSGIGEQRHGLRARAFAVEQAHSPEERRGKELIAGAMPDRRTQVRWSIVPLLLQHAVQWGLPRCAAVRIRVRQTVKGGSTAPGLPTPARADPHHWQASTSTFLSCCLPPALLPAACLLPLLRVCTRTELCSATPESVGGHARQRQRQKGPGLSAVLLLPPVPRGSLASRLFHHPGAASLCAVRITSFIAAQLPPARWRRSVRSRVCSTRSVWNTRIALRRRVELVAFQAAPIARAVGCGAQPAPWITACDIQDSMQTGGCGNAKPGTRTRLLVVRCPLAR